MRHLYFPLSCICDPLWQTCILRSDENSKFPLSLTPTLFSREAHGYYTTAADTLRQTGDWLWLANCLEGLAAIAVLVHYPGIQRPTGLRRNSSLQALQRVKRADSATSQMGGQQQQQRQLDSLRAVVSNPTDLVDMFRERDC